MGEFPFSDTPLVGENQQKATQAETKPPGLQAAVRGCCKPHVLTSTPEINMDPQEWHYSIVTLCLAAPFLGLRFNLWGCIFKALFIGQHR